MEIYGYSERGMINAILYDMALNSNKNNSAMEKFLKLIIKKDGNKLFEELKTIRELKIYIEPSFSGFGDPDVLISFISNKEKYVVFFEAKVKTWHRKSEWRDLDVEKSGVLAQLRNKIDLFEHREEIEKNGFYEKRSIGKNEIVNKTFKVVCNAQKAFYVGWLPLTDGESFFEKFQDEKNVGLLTWENLRKIKSLSKRMKLMASNFIYNESEVNGESRSQIYFIKDN
ncbi:MAG TPA: hypothetical protein PLB12_11580 [Candidatus Goldiibacteriota bacterium]|nr:hypothetical protein [Candidatus Goldiibacteriota bacterium]